MNNLDSQDRQVQLGMRIEQLIAEITERCAELYPRNFQLVAKELMVNRNATVTSDQLLLDKMRELTTLENDQDADNPFIGILDLK